MKTITFHIQLAFWTRNLTLNINRNIKLQPWLNKIQLWLSLAQVSPRLFNPTWRGSFLTKFTAGGGRNHLHPSNQPKNQIFRLNHGRTLKYRQLLDSRKKNGVNRPKIGPPQKSSLIIDPLYNKSLNRQIFPFKRNLVNYSGAVANISGPIVSFLPHE